MQSRVLATIAWIRRLPLMGVPLGRKLRSRDSVLQRAIQFLRSDVQELQTRYAHVNGSIRPVIATSVPPDATPIRLCAKLSPSVGRRRVARFGVLGPLLVTDASGQWL